MAARPPGGGGSSEPDAIEFGIAVLDEQIGKADVSFPATAEEVRHASATARFPTTAKGGRSRSARRSIRCHRAGSENKTEFLDALYPVFDRKRREGGGLQRACGTRFLLTPRERPSDLGLAVLR